MAELYEARQEPAPREIVVAILARLANNLGGDRPNDSWTMLLDDYAEDLAGISELHLREITGGLRRSGKWFPKAAEIIEQWNALRYREIEMRRRARVLIGLEEPKPWETT